MAVLSSPISSSMIRSASYDEDDNQTLTITFASGNTASYEGVPVDEYHGLVNASSAGKYFHANIKDSFRSK